MVKQNRYKKWLNNLSCANLGNKSSLKPAILKCNKYFSLGLGNCYKNSYGPCVKRGFHV